MSAARIDGLNRVGVDGLTNITEFLNVDEIVTLSATSSTSRKDWNIVRSKFPSSPGVQRHRQASIASWCKSFVVKSLSIMGTSLITNPLAGHLKDRMWQLTTHTHIEKNLMDKALLVNRLNIVENSCASISIRKGLDIINDILGQAEAKFPIMDCALQVRSGYSYFSHELKRYFLDKGAPCVGFRYFRMYCYLPISSIPCYSVGCTPGQIDVVLSTYSDRWVPGGSSSNLATLSLWNAYQNGMKSNSSCNTLSALVESFERHFPDNRLRTDFQHDSWIDINDMSSEGNFLTKVLYPKSYVHLNMGLAEICADSLCDVAETMRTRKVPAWVRVSSKVAAVAIVAYVVESSVVPYLATRVCVETGKAICTLIAKVARITYRALFSRAH